MNLLPHLGELGDGRGLLRLLCSLPNLGSEDLVLYSSGGARDVQGLDPSNAAEQAAIARIQAMRKKDETYRAIGAEICRIRPWRASWNARTAN